jgi:RHS repeat-associated protein
MRVVRRLAIGLVIFTGLLAAVFVARSPYAFSDEATAEDPSAALSAPPSASEAEELPGKRTATSDTYELPSGERETRIFQTPVNYRDESGDWRPIEEGLEREGGAFVNGESSFDVQLPKEMGAAPVRVDFGDQWVAERLLGKSTEAGQLEEEAASYEAASPGTGFEFSTLATGLEEKITLANASEPSTFHFELTTSAGLEPELVEGGAIEFRDPEGKVIAELPAPVMYDSSSPPQISNAVDYGLQQRSGGSWELTLEANREWLSAPQRQFPAVIDPVTSEKKSINMDCSIFGGAYETYSGFCGSAGWQWDEAFSWRSTQEVGRALLYFPIDGAGGGLPKNAYVTEAGLSLYEPAAAQNTKAVQVRNVVDAGTEGWSTSASWRWGWCYAGTCRNWFNKGGDFGFDNWQISTSERGSQAGWWNFGGASGMTEIVQDWATGATKNWGLLVKQDEDSLSCTEGGVKCKDSSAMFASSAYSEAADRPYLAVNWWPQAPTTSKLATPTEGTRTARRLKLTSTWAAGVTAIVGYQWREGKSGPFKTIPESLIRDENGQPVHFPKAVEPGELSAHLTNPVYFDAAHASETLTKKGGTVQVRALFEGGAGYAGYSAPVEAVVNRYTGGPKDATAEVGPGTVDLLTGNFSVSRTDVSIPAFNMTMSFGRTLSSRGIFPGPGTSKTHLEELAETALQEHGVLGLGWKPSAELEGSGTSEWRSIKIMTEKETLEEGETYEFSYALVTGAEGGELTFERNVNGTNVTFVTPEDMTGWSLSAGEGGTLVLADPSGTRTTFKQVEGTEEYVPSGFSQLSGSGHSARMVWKFESKTGTKRLTEIIAPEAPGVSTCTEGEGSAHAGCKTLTFTYEPATKWKASAWYGERLARINYWEPGAPGAQGWSVAEYSYNTEGRLVKETDPRTGLSEEYTYTPEGQLKTIKPPGQEPWTMEYGAIEGEEANGRLMAVTRPSLVPEHPVAKTTVAYGVPLTTPYEMSGSKVAEWGQKDLPLDATAIFPPDQEPTSSPPSSYSHATVYYMDAEGHAVNTATPAGAGTSAGSITTSEVDQFGNVTRELSAQNRVRALAAGSGSVAKSHELETLKTYSADGTELLEERGPMHQIRLESGTSTQGRLYRSIVYENPSLPGLPPPHLPTKETTAALVSGTLYDQRITETEYNKELRKPTKTVVDPGEGHLRITSVTVYDKDTGLPTETRQPSNPEGGKAGTTKTIYYSTKKKIQEPAHPECAEAPLYAGLPCLVLPAGQASGENRPTLLVKKFLAYDQLSQPTEVTESPGGGSENARKTFVSYDEAGRVLSRKSEGGGVKVEKQITEYESSTGLPKVERFACESSCTDSQATTMKYDALGRPIEYEDADGNKSKTTYDIDGRPITASDNKGSQTMTYDPTSGLLTKLEDSGAGTFTASYDADGNIVERTLPDGLTAKTTYNEVGEPTKLAYTKATSTWYEENLERSIFGQIATDNGTFVNDSYFYDKAGRLLEARETPTNGSCTTRAYRFEGSAGLDSNRTSMETRSPEISGACVTSGGAKKEYKYDAADRLEGPTYDAWGRITKLPEEFAGGKELTTEYFSTDMVAKQIQNGITNSYELDGSGRQRMRLQGGGGLEGNEIFHYDGPSDSVGWTERGSTWTRSIGGIGGELAAVQESGSGVTLQLTDLHGDVVATAEPSPTATELKAKFRFDEFGNPVSGSAGRFGWLGGKARRTELASGVIQMGARSYVPSLGRFLTPDPIPGGSANPYDYANQDPVNNSDLTGECSRLNPNCLSRQIKKFNQRARREAQTHGLHRLGHYGTGARASSLLPSTGGLGTALFNDVQEQAGPTAGKVASAVFNAVMREVESGADTRDAIFGAAMAAAARVGGSSWQEKIGCAKGATEMFVATRPLAAGGPDGVMAIGLSMAVGCGLAFVP